MRYIRFLTFLACPLIACLWLPAAAALSPESAAKNQPVTPFRIAGDVYYVGASDVTSYLIVTPHGMILLDGGFAETAPMIEANIAALGFKLKDVKVLLNGHAHPDHAGGLAKLKADSGAEFEAMAPEVQPLEHEGRGTFYRGDRRLFDSIYAQDTTQNHKGEQGNFAFYLDRSWHPADGTYRIEVESFDTRGNRALATTSVSVAHGEVG